MKCFALGILFWRRKSIPDDVNEAKEQAAKVQDHYAKGVACQTLPENIQQRDLHESLDRYLLKILNASEKVILGREKMKSKSPFTLHVIHHFMPEELLVENKVK